MKILVTGLRGQLASALMRIGSLKATVQVAAVGRPVLDLEQPDDGVIARFAPDVVVNAAAYTAVDRAEQDEGLAFRVNADGAGRIANAAARFGVPIIQLSTDYVFSGTKPNPYIETDVTGPLNAYGRSKLAGERRVAEANPRHVILRTSWIYSAAGTNFLRTMLSVAGSKLEINVVDDQFGAPTSAHDIAGAIIRIAERLCEDRDDSAFGIFHMTAFGDTSWCGFAQKIFEESAKHGGPTASVHPIPTTAYPMPARRPQNSRLDCRKIADAYGIILPPWQDSVSKTVAAALDSE
jgi:dTDP-4-dehydrorhamnose reductase